MTASFDALCAEYKRTQLDLTEKERVQREHELWKNYCVECPRRNTTRTAWFVAQFGGSALEYEIRAVLASHAERLQKEGRNMNLDVAIDLAMAHHRSIVTPIIAASNGKSTVAQDVIPAEPEMVPETQPATPVTEKPTEKPTVAQQVEQLCAEYRALDKTSTHQERADREEQLWLLQKRLISYKDGKGERREYQLQKLLGGSTGCYARHRSINSLGEAANEIWYRLERDLTLGATQNIAIRARVIAKKQKMALREAVHRALIEYDNSKVRRSLDDGKVVRENVAKGPKGPKVRSWSAKAASVSPAYAKSAAPAPRSGHAGKDADSFRYQVRLLTEQFIKDRLSEADDYIRNKAIQDFADWIDTGVTDLFAAVRKHAENARRENLGAIGRRRFGQACQILSIAAEFGKKLDPMLVKRRAHARSASLHPDKHGDKYTEEMRAEFQAIQEARLILEEYIRQFKR
jgi:hypothetical protein